MRIRKMTKIVSTKDILDGKPRIKGTRVSADQIYQMHIEKGMTREKIAEVLPSVDLDDVNAAIKYMG